MSSTEGWRLEACRPSVRPIGLPRPSSLNFSTIQTAQSIIIKEKSPKVLMLFPKKETPDLLHEKITIFIPNLSTGPSVESIIQQLNIRFEVVFQNLFFPGAPPSTAQRSGRLPKRLATLPHNETRLSPVPFMFQKGTYSSECLEIHKKDCC